MMSYEHLRLAKSCLSVALSGNLNAGSENLCIRCTVSVATDEANGSKVASLTLTATCKHGTCSLTSKWSLVTEFFGEFHMLTEMARCKLAIKHSLIRVIAIFCEDKCRDKSLRQTFFECSLVCFYGFHCLTDPIRRKWASCDFKFAMSLGLANSPDCQPFVSQRI